MYRKCVVAKSKQITYHGGKVLRRAAPAAFPWGGIVVLGGMCVGEELNQPLS